VTLSQSDTKENEIGSEKKSNNQENMEIAKIEKQPKIEEQEELIENNSYSSQIGYPFSKNSILKFTLKSGEKSNNALVQFVIFICYQRY
jgi:hypothetical protein